MGKHAGAIASRPMVFDQTKGYARVRDGQWADLDLCDLEGHTLGWVPESEWVESVCFDGMGTGLYVLTDDEDTYFTAPSIDLEFEDGAVLAKRRNRAPRHGRYYYDVNVWANEEWMEVAVYSSWQDEHGEFIRDEAVHFGALDTMVAIWLVNQNADWFGHWDTFDAWFYFDSQTDPSEGWSSQFKWDSQAFGEEGSEDVQSRLNSFFNELKYVTVKWEQNHDREVASC